MQLFRQQALDHQNRLHGEVFLVPPLRWQAIGWLLFLATIGCGVLLAFGSYSRTIQASGVIRIAQEGDLSGLADGRVARIDRESGASDREAAPIDVELALINARPDGKASSFTVERTPTEDEASSIGGGRVPSDGRINSANTGPSTNVAAPTDIPRTTDLNHSGNDVTFAQTNVEDYPKSALKNVTAMDASWIAELRVPLADARRIAPGQQVSLSVRGYPADIFGGLTGTIRAVGAVNADVDVPYLPVTVRLPSPSPQQTAAGLMLQGGLRVDATVTIGRISLLQWLFEPVLPGAKVAS